jgi:hypothetical protein
VHYETEGQVGIIPLDRPHKLNAISAAIKDQIIAVPLIWRAGRTCYSSFRRDTPKVAASKLGECH